MSHPSALSPLKEYYRLLLSSIFLVVWGLSLWHPASPQDWFLENKVTLLFVPIVFGFCIWYVRFSKLSFTLITVFLILHTIGSHYGYGSVPLGFWLSKITGIETNLYDKLVHFSFGLLIVYPLREFFLRVARTSGFWSYLAPFTAVMTMASLYEIFEWVTVQNIDPKLAYMFIGGSDPFDTTKDMFSALLGTAISLGIVAVLERVDQKSSFWKNIKGSFKRDTMDAPKEDRILHKDIL